MKNYILKATLVLALISAFISCRKEDSDDVITKTVPMEGTQEVPAVVTSAVAKVEYSYNKATKNLTYKITWSNLTDTCTAMHIHGMALRGQSTGVVQNFTLGPLQRRKEGTYTGTYLIDGIAVKEADLLAGKYYFNLHTKAYPGGEVRGQIEF